MRLNALGIAAIRKCASGRDRVATGAWKPDRIAKMVHKGLYTGTHVHRSRHGVEAVAVPPLIDEDLRAAAERSLKTNRQFASKNARRLYLLRGLVECAECGAAYCGTTHAVRKIPYYVCNGNKVNRRYGGARACNAKSVRGDHLEAAVWADCAAFLQNPGPALAEAQRQLRARLSDLPKLEAERVRLVENLAEKDIERERAMTLYRRGRVSLDDAERQIDEVQKEAAQLRQQIEAIRTAEELSEAAETQYTDAVAMAADLATELEQIEAAERGDDLIAKRATAHRKRRIIERLVRRITIAPTGDGIGRAQVVYRFRPPRPSGSSSFASAKHEENPDAPRIATEFADTVRGAAVTV